MSVITQALRALGFIDSPEAIVTNARSGVLTRGQMYRVFADVDEDYVDRTYRSASGTLGQTVVQEQLSNDLVGAGFAHALLCVQDPSDPKIWTFLARWLPDPAAAGGAPTRPPERVGTIRFLRFEPTEEPARVSPLVDVASLDIGLSEDDLYLAHRTLTREDDPKKLAGMAACFDEDFPIVASLLRNKARLVSMNTSANRETGPIRVSERNGVMHPIDASDHATLSTLKEASRDVDGGDYLDLFANVFRVFRWTPPVTAARHGQEALDLLEPELLSIPIDERAAGFGKIATLFSRKPEMTREPIKSLVESTSLPRVIVAAGVAAASDHGHGIFTLDPAVVRVLRPTGPRPVSLGALKMAFAILRPEGSLAAAPSELGPVLSDLRKAVRSGDTFAIKAETSLKRARRYLDRQNWIAWTRRYEAAEGMTL